MLQCEYIELNVVDYLLENVIYFGECILKLVSAFAGELPVRSRYISKVLLSFKFILN